MSEQKNKEQELRLGDSFGWVVALGFFLLAGWFFLTEPVEDDPLTDPVRVQASLINSGVFRTKTSEPPIVVIGGMNQQCNSCHTLFESKQMSPRRLAQHTELTLNHGGNEWCFSCHDTENRNKLVLAGGEQVGYDRVPELCGKCHGPAYRDWEVGIHGKTLGYWNKEMGKQIRLSCTECHDPHSPAFPMMELLPGPNTLRMGEGDAKIDRHDHKHNPLRQWQEQKQNLWEEGH